MVSWQANDNANDDQFSDFVISMSNVLGQLRTFASAFDSSRNNLVGISRSLSVEIRKLLLDGLLSRCVRRPLLHPLIYPNQLKGNPFEDIFEISDASLRITKLDEPMAGQTALIPIAPMKHTTVIYPLYGLHFQEDADQWVSENPFDETLSPVKLNRWLKQLVLQIDTDAYDIRMVLSEVANTQGAHSDYQNDTIRQQINRRFQGAYLNIFVLTVATYLCNQFSVSVSSDSSLKDRIAKVHPGVEDESYRVESILVFDRDQFSTRMDWLELHPIGVIQQSPLVGGIPEVKSDDLLARTPILSRSEIRVPSPESTTSDSNFPHTTKSPPP